jgi:hypothetical protein
MLLSSKIYFLQLEISEVSLIRERPGVLLSFLCGKEESLRSLLYSLNRKGKLEESQWIATGPLAMLIRSFAVYLYQKSHGQYISASGQSAQITNSFLIISLDLILIYF